MPTERPLSVARLIDSPLGPISLAAGSAGLVALSIGDSLERFEDRLGKELSLDPEAADLQAALDHVAAYLRGEQRDLHLPIDWSRIEGFQAEVLREVCRIPYGQTRSYGEIARAIGRPSGASRAVGRANATNPLPLVIPCHRVLAADGGLQGYGAGEGVRTKAWLLRLEGSRLL